ncbi:MAG: hypothetical protein AAFY15_15235, partial [Cyanobacteria bacterium J06648_11]
MGASLKLRITRVPSDIVRSLHLNERSNAPNFAIDSASQAAATLKSKLPAAIAPNVYLSCEASMAFNIRQLDTLTYDEAEPILDDYITHVVEDFLASEIGNTYAEQHPEAGNWIATFVEMAYLFGEFTIPKMTKRDAQTVMSAILPRKLTLPDPQVADNAISELVAFWTYLKETYRFRSAG